MMQLSDRAKKLKPSPTVALNTLAKELAAQGKDIINLAVVDPNII
jgi:aspartate aminotransferase